ncbi:MAG: alpha/beta hydrolase [Actinomycetota bacterium]
MASMTPTEAADLFRAPPGQMIDVGQGATVAHRSVGSGPDVVFVHGWPVSGATYRTLLPYLADDVTCHLLDLPGAGSSSFSATTPLGLQLHIDSVRSVVDQLGLDDVAIVGHDSGGMLARHALAGDERVRAWGLIDTEQPQGTGWRFNLFLNSRHLPGFGSALGWLAGKPALRRNQFVLGGAFVDRSLLDGEFDEFFLEPLHNDAAYRAATMRLLKSFDKRYVSELGALHAKIDTPVQMVWGADDLFFPVDGAREMVSTFANAKLAVIDNAALFSHEERPAEVAAALLPTLAGSG